jgi:hypothetical protein
MPKKKTAKPIPEKNPVKELDDLSLEVAKLRKFLDSKPKRETK